MKTIHESQVPKGVWDLFTSLNEQIAALAAELEEVKTVMAVSEVEFSGLQNKVKGIELQIATILEQITTLSKSFNDQLTGSVTSIDLAIETVQSTTNERFVLVEQQIQNADGVLKQEIEKLQTNVDAQIQTAQTSLISTIGDESKARGLADEGLTTLITNELDSRVSADESLNKLVDEMAARLNLVEVSYLDLSFNSLSLAITDIPLDTNYIELPIVDKYGSTITWNSQPSGFIQTDGNIISRPTFEQGDQLITLTALIEYGEQSKVKTFLVTVASEDKIEPPVEVPPVVEPEIPTEPVEDDDLSS